MTKILLVDDEPDILEFIGYNLQNEGFKVFTSGSGKEGIEIALREKPQVIILDIMMPEMDGVETCTYLRNEPGLESTLIIFLTARGEDYSQIAALDAGGDDYVTKPIRPRVLISRINALLRLNRRKPDNTTGNHIYGVLLDNDRYSVLKDGLEHDLPRKEFELLALLMSKPGKVFTRKVILNTVWGEDVYVNDRTIDVHIRKLRRKLGEDYIRTVKGIGYKFEA